MYLAEDKNLDRTAAIKFLSPELLTDPDIKKRFQREARAAAALKHPNIITVYEMGVYQDGFYIAMEYIEGKSLGEVIKQEESSVEQIIEITIQICEGLCKAHRVGIIHRDIKPANIMIDKDGWVKVLDFGIAKLKDTSQSTSGERILGTLAYMSPEQARGEKVDHRSDIFSVGLVLYELITRKYPFNNESGEAIFYSILNEEPEPLARYKKGITEGLQRIIDKALDKDRETRYQSCEDLIADLKKQKKMYMTVSQTKTQQEVNKNLRKTQTMISGEGKDKTTTKPKIKLVAALVVLLVISVLGVAALFMNRDSANVNKSAQEIPSVKSTVDRKSEPNIPTHSALMSELLQVSEANILKERLRKYTQEMRIAAGDRKDFANPEGCYVFIHDKEKVVGVFIYKRNFYYDVNTQEKLSSLGDKFAGMSAIWVQDFSRSK